MDHLPDNDVGPDAGRSGPKMVIVGIGGAGCSVVSRMWESESWTGKTVAIDTDRQELFGKPADEKALLDRTPMDDSELESAVEEISTGISEDTGGPFSGADLLVLAVGLGGKSGSRISPAVARLGKRHGALVIGVVVLPFGWEGGKRTGIAEEGQWKLSKEADMVVLLSGDDFMESISDLPLEEALGVMDGEIERIILSLTSLLEDLHRFDPDFESVETVFGEMGLTRVGRAECDIGTESTEIAEKIIESSLLRTNLKYTGGSLLKITTGSRVSPDKIDGIVRKISGEIGGEQVIWGTGIDEGLGDTLRAFLLAPDTRFGMMDLDIEVL